jgi:hypothetical protein
MTKNIIIYGYVQEELTLLISRSFRAQNKILGIKDKGLLISLTRNPLFLYKQDIYIYGKKMGNKE